MRERVRTVVGEEKQCGVTWSRSCSSRCRWQPRSVRPSGEQASRLESLDRRVDPCTDFYQFACGGWIEKNPLPADRQQLRPNPGGPGSELRRPASPARDAGRHGDSRKASDYYASCIDTAAIEAKGLRPLEPILARIDALRSRKELPELVGYLHRVAAEPPRLGSPVGGVGVPVLQPRRAQRSQ